MKRILLLLIGVMVMVAVSGTAWAGHSVATWHENKTAAFTFTFDDGYDSHVFIAAPLLAERGFPGTFFQRECRLRGRHGHLCDNAIDGA